MNFVSTPSTHLKLARKIIDKFILDTIQNSPVLGYVLPNGSHFLLDKTDVKENLSNSFNFSDYIDFVPIPKKVKKSRIKQAGSMELDTFIENDEWDTGTNRCVCDWFIYKYKMIKGFIKMCTYENIEKMSIMGLSFDEDIIENTNPNYYGYTIDHVRNINPNYYGYISTF